MSPYDNKEKHPHHQMRVAEESKLIPPAMESNEVGMTSAKTITLMDDNILNSKRSGWKRSLTWSVVSHWSFCPCGRLIIS